MGKIIIHYEQTYSLTKNNDMETTTLATTTVAVTQTDHELLIIMSFIAIGAIVGALVSFVTHPRGETASTVN